MSCFHCGVFLPFDCKMILLNAWMIYILDSVYSCICKGKHYLKTYPTYLQADCRFCGGHFGCSRRIVKILAEILTLCFCLTGILFQLFLRMKFLQTNMLWISMVTSHSLCLLLIILHTRVNNYVADLQLRHIKKTKQNKGYLCMSICEKIYRIQKFG